MNKDERVQVLSLGAGLQSSALYLMAASGELPGLDFAVFADTQAEPRAVYQTLWRLGEVASEPGAPPIFTATRGDLGVHCETAASDGRSASNPPLFTGEGSGLLRRKCTIDWKITVIRREMRRHLGRSASVDLWLGITTDEAHRMKPSRVQWVRHQYPLIDLNMRRSDVSAWFRDRGMDPPAASACVFCPYRSDANWRRLKSEDPDGFARAVRFDHTIRAGFSGSKAPPFVHRSCRPLDVVNFSESQRDLFGDECAGICGV